MTLPPIPENETPQEAKARKRQTLKALLYERREMRGKSNGIAGAPCREAPTATCWD